MRSRWIPALLLLGPLSASADEVARLPLGPQDRAYLLATASPGAWVDGRTGSEATFDDVVASLASADVVVLAETHVSPAGHSAKARIVEALAATGDTFSLGMEFLESGDDAALDRWTAGELDVDALLEAVGWYADGAFSFEAYRPMLEAARARRAPVFGLNVPRTVIRTVSRTGYAALSEAERARVGPLADPLERHRFLVDLLMGGLGASMPSVFDGMFAGQRAWDAAMATAILRHREGHPGRTIVAVVGSGHALHGLGVPERLRALAPTLDVRVVVPVEAERPSARAATHPGFEAQETATFSRGVGDWIHVLPDEDGAEAWPRLGARLVTGEGGAVRVDAVSPAGLAAQAGVEVDDVLVALDGRPLAGVERVRTALAALPWSKRSVLRVSRGGMERDLPFLVLPAVDGMGGEGTWLTSRAASFALDGFDPRSARSWRDPWPESAPASVHARLVHLREDEPPVRLDVLDGRRLLQAWDLDAAGRIVRGQLADPSRDGAVRVEIERDARGAATAERRLDAAGRIIEPASPPPQAEHGAPPPAPPPTAR